jgi:aminopeptidase-like protein
LSKKGSVDKTLSKKLEYLSYCDGKKSFIEISNKLNLDVKHSKEILKFLKKNNLIKLNKFPE